jgi:hypothetical protein
MINSNLVPISTYLYQMESKQSFMINSYRSKYYNLGFNYVNLVEAAQN